MPFGVGETLHAEVGGSQYEPYQVRIDLDDTGIVATACSCPYDHGGICKHRVAVLLTYIRDPDGISHRPSVANLPADLNQETLYELFVDVLADRSDLADRVERRIETQSLQWTADTSISETTHDWHTTSDPDTIRRHVRRIVHALDSRDTPSPRADVERRVDDLRNHLEEAGMFIDASEGKTRSSFSRRWPRMTSQP